MTTRRSFFQDLALLSALAAALEGESHAETHDDKTSNFWDAYFTEAARDPHTVSRAGTEENLIDPSRKVQLIQGTPDGLRYPDTIADSDLPADTEDVVVTVSASHFRAAPEDHKAISKSKGCQVRLDLFQTRPIMPLVAPIAWAGLAALSFDKTVYTPSYRKDINGKIITDKHGKPIIDTKVTPGPAVPALKDLNFKDPNDPNAPVQNQVVLKGGSGRMALNVRAVRQSDRLKTVMDNGVNYASIVAPFFGFAPIAIPALRAFTQLLGAVFNHEAVIMNSMPVQLVATQSALKLPQPAGSVKIVTGDYIAVPDNQTPVLKDAMGKLRVNQGYLVHQDTPANMPIEQRAQDGKIPDVSYIGMHLTVQPLAEALKEHAKG